MDIAYRISTEEGRVAEILGWVSPTKRSKCSKLILYLNNGWIIDSISDAAVIYTLDENFRYWKIEIDDEKEKMASPSNYGLYRFL